MILACLIYLMLGIGDNVMVDTVFQYSDRDSCHLEWRILFAYQYIGDGVVQFIAHKITNPTQDLHWNLLVEIPLAIEY